MTGNINDFDLNSIKNLTALIKLDLSEAAITNIPQNFLSTRRCLTEVKLPSSLNSIGNSAFNGCSRLQVVDINGVATIESYVFSGCSSLTYINLIGVKKIGDCAFEGCTSLDGIDLSSVETLGYSAFRECGALRSVDLSSAKKIGSVTDSYSGYGCFSNCNSLEDLKLGNNTEFIESGCFSGTRIKELKVPEGVKTINSSTFCNCSNLVSVELPSKLETINGGAFYGCVSLEEITIPPSVRSIGWNAFDNTGIKTFKCLAVVPPIVTSSFIGENMDMTRIYLYVPPFSKDFYRNTKYWNDFFLMRSIDDQIDYILVDRPVTINLEEEDNEVVANNPEIALTAGAVTGGNNNEIGQLTARGEGTLSAGRMTIDALLGSRYRNNYQYCPTLINYADKMRADSVVINIWLRSYNSSNEWHFISLPFDVKVSDIVSGDGTYWTIRRYDSSVRASGNTSETWVNLTGGDTMKAGQGYIISTTGKDGEYLYPRLTFGSGNSVTKNNFFRSTDIVVPLAEYNAEFPHNRSWNFIGNPYPCYYDMHYINEEFTAPITVWNGSSYVAYSPVDDDLVLSPYEAFFVQCPLDAKEMTFKEGGRLHSDEGKYMYKSPAINDSFISAEDRNVFNFVLTGENYEDRARVVFNAEAKSEYEIGRDASKFFAGNNGNAQIYVNADVAYSISERPVNDGIATLGIRSSKEDVYTLALTGKFSNEWSVMLTDNETGITVDLTKESYEFISSTKENSSRFSVKFTLDSNGQTGIDSIVADYGKNAMVTVADINGIMVYNGRLADINVPTSGLYLISNGKETRKAILK